MKKKYYLFIIGRFISSFGNWFVDMALPFVIYALTGSAMAVSVSFLLETLPIILLFPMTSYVIDHYSKKRIIQICEMVSALAVFLCILTSCQNLYVLYSSCVVLAVVGNVYNTTVSSYIPDISRGLDLEFANTIDSFANNVAMITAPILAGLCIKQLGNVVSFGIDIASFLLSVVLLSFLPKDTAETKAKENDKEESIYNKFKDIFSLKEVFSIFQSNRILKIIVMICVMFSACGAIFSSLDAVYIAEVFNNSTDVYGYINSAWGVGMLITSALYFIYKNVPEFKMFSLGILFMGIATIGYGLSGSVTICIFFNFLGGLANTLYVVYYKSLLQRRTESGSLGKVFASQSTLSKIVSVLVVSIAGGFADVLSVRYVIIFSGMITVVISVISYYLLKIQADSVS